jgi:hypothetical protein
MRKQTKLVAVLSAAALLAIGASMTSFAKGWTEENGEWVYLNSDGDRVTNEWKKSGNNYYWLDDDGLMATSELIEDDDKTYYVNENGVRVTSQWVALDNEDDVEVNGEDVETLWYYFSDTGKAFKASSSTETFVKKTVAYSGGTDTFFFDADGHMASGWVSYGGKTYYCGDENEGWALKYFQLLEPADDMDGDYDDEEWFYFGSNGKLVTSATKYYQGAYYTFDENGVMQDDWFTGTIATAANSSVVTPSTANIYASESGALGSGWVLTARYDDDTETKWYYLVNVTSGDTTRSVAFNSFEDPNNNYYGVMAKTINSKTYVFDKTGYLLKGLLDDDVTTTTPSQWMGVAAKSIPAGIYYAKEGSITSSTYGQIQTGKVAVTDDGETDYYYFDSKNSGAALQNMVKDNTVYGPDGKRIDAEDGNSTEIKTAAEDIYKYDSSKADFKGTKMISAGERYIVTSTGKLKTKSTGLKIDDLYYDTDANGVINEATAGRSTK